MRDWDAFCAKILRVQLGDVLVLTATRDGRTHEVGRRATVVGIQEAYHWPDVPRSVNYVYKWAARIVVEQHEHNGHRKWYGDLWGGIWEDGDEWEIEREWLLKPFEPESWRASWEAAGYSLRANV